MTNTPFTHKLRKRAHEATVVEPNDLGIPFLTVVYRSINGYFKHIPFVFVIPLALVFALLILFIFGVVGVRLVSLLQYGF